jgi:hypothetical protein
MRRRLAALLAAFIVIALFRAPAQAAPDPATPDELVRELEALMDGHTDSDEEARILALLRGASATNFDLVVRRLDIDGLLGDVDDHIVGADHYTDLVGLLSRERAADLTVEARAAVISAMQRGSTDGLEEVAIKDLLVATHRSELTALKNLIDGGGDYHDLEQLVFHDIDDEALQEAILAHFAREGDNAGAPEVKVLSDIDDTIYRNWVDPRFPAKTVYPGVRALYRELDLGADERGREGDLGFLTARPGDRAGVVEGETLATLSGLGIARAIVLTGSLGNITTNEAIAEGKLANFVRYERLFPEYGFVFLGDSGQGDAILAEWLMRDHAQATRAVFIHDVVSTGRRGRAAWLEKRVPLFDGYVGEAVEAHAKGLISAAGLARVARAALADFAGITFEDPRMRDARRVELVRDIAAANAALPEADRVALTR